MADTKVYVEAEDWIRLTWMPQQFNQMFFRERLPLESGGVFDFDAVSVDRKIAASISASGGYTSTGKPAIAKLMKIRSDILFLLLAKTERKLVILADKTMYDICLKEMENGRMPRMIEFQYAELPLELARRLNVARRLASDEVSPRKAE